MPGSRSRRSATRSTRVRRAARQRGLAARAEPPASERSGTDDRLALLFACCHPALAPEARLALTLRAVVGLTTPQIARAFLVNEATLAQRIVRAKRKIVTAGIALAVPPPAELPERLGDVLAVVYVMFNEGFVSSTGATQDRDLAADAVWLAEVVATSLPAEAEAWGLAALLTHPARPRRGALRRVRRRWCCCATRTARSGTAPPSPPGEAHLERAAALTRPAATSCRPPSPPATPPAPPGRRPTGCRSSRSTTCCSRHDPSPVVRLNRAVALAQLGPDQAEVALAEVDALADRLDGYHLFHATRAELLDRLGRDAEAAAANTRALELTTNDAERRLLTTRLHRHPLTDGS